MVVTSFETRVLCDNCGRWVSRQRVDASTFEQFVTKTDPDEDDLYTEDQDRPVSVVVTHVPVCRRCQETT
jgi:hypothetical protein